MQQYPGEHLRYRFVGSIGFWGAEYLGNQSILVGNPSEANQNCMRIAVDESPLTLSAGDILHEPLKNRIKLFLQAGQSLFMSFQSRKQDDALDQRIAAIRVEDAADERPEQPLIIVALHAMVDFFYPFRFVAGIQVEFQNGAIERLFGREVLENYRFGHAGGSSDFLGRGAFESPAGECI